MFESILYTDPQAAKPACFCPRCGGECYWPSLLCIRCQSTGRSGKSEVRNCVSLVL